MALPSSERKAPNRAVPGHRDSLPLALRRGGALVYMLRFEGCRTTPAQVETKVTLVDNRSGSHVRTYRLTSRTKI